MKEEDVKIVLKSLVGCVSSVTEKQALILQLLSRELPSLDAESRTKLEQSADENYQRVKILQIGLERL